MKKLALFAMLLGSSFLYGCGEAGKTDKKGTTEPAPAAGTTEPKKEGTEATTPADPAKPAEDPAKPAEPAK